MRQTAVLLALLLVMPFSGCVANMAEFKEALGVTPPPAEYDAPLARIEANATTTMVGAPVRFSAETSRDPQGLALSHVWRVDADDHEGPTLVHAFATPGEHQVVLRVTNEAGLQDAASIIIQVDPLNAPPVAAIAITDASGATTARTTNDVALRFDALGARDPEGTTLTYTWDMGDGTTSTRAQVDHAYADPGVYTVMLTVRDAAGAEATSTSRVAVDGAWSFTGAFEPTGPNQVSHDIIVVDAARELVVVLSYDAGAGLTDLKLRLFDAAGTEVGNAQGAPGAPAQGGVERTVNLGGAALDGAKQGPWRVVVERATGLDATYAVEVSESV